MFIPSKKKRERVNWKKLWHEIIYFCHRGRQTVRDVDGWRRGAERVSGVRVILY